MTTRRYYIVALLVLALGTFGAYGLSSFSRSTADQPVTSTNSAASGLPTVAPITPDNSRTPGVSDNFYLTLGQMEQKLAR